MIYLKNRDRFLNESKEKLIKEVFENDITLGGSLLGRLINSSIRRFKIGFNQVKIDPLLKKLEDELNYLISASLQGDILKKYNEFRVKSYLENIKDICLKPEQTSSEESKLEELLGQSEDLYFPNDPKRNSRTLGIVQEAIDVITDDLKDLKKFIGEDRDKLIDHLSDFNDELRKLTIDSPVGGSNNSSDSNFNTNFMNVLHAAQQNQLIVSSYKADSNFKLLTYNLFLEKMGTQSNVNPNNPKSNQSNNDNPSKGNQSNNDNSNNKNSQNQKTISATQSSQQVSSATHSVADKKSGIHVELPKDYYKKETEEVISILKSDEDAKKNPKVKSFFNKMILKVKPNEKSSSIKVKYNGVEISLKDAISNLEKEINEKIIYENRFIGQDDEDDREEISRKKTVREVWEDFWGQYDKDGVYRLSQREVDELNSMLKNGVQDLKYDPAKRPDPIISIARIFGQAHNLYYCDVIPSGRPGGKISQKTLREYIKLGSGNLRYDKESGPEGPFAVKSIFNKWSNGVMKILQDQNYRKILSNINFIVPGSEDKFNKNESLLVESENQQDMSHGQILFQFMNDMLNKKKLDDFDALRSSLLSKYFGVKQEDYKKIPHTSPRSRNPNKEDIQQNYMYWQPCSKIESRTDKARFYAIPIEPFHSLGMDHQVIFLQIIRIQEISNGKKGFLCRFTYDSPVIISKYHETKFPKMSYQNWKIASTNNIYYGIISCTNNTSSVDLTDNSSIDIVYANVNTSDNINDVYAHRFKIKSGTKNLENGNAQNISPSRLIYNNSNSQIIIVKDEFDKKVFPNELNTHDSNLNRDVEKIAGQDQSPLVKLGEALKRRFLMAESSNWK